MKASQSTPDNGTARVRENNPCLSVCDMIKGLEIHEFKCTDPKVIARWVLVDGKMIRIL